VTVPSFLNADLSEDNFSNFVSGLTSSIKEVEINSFLK